MADLEIMHQKFHKTIALKQARRAARHPALKHANVSHEDDDDFDDDDEDEKDEHDEIENKVEGDEGEGKENTTKDLKRSRNINRAVAELIGKDYQVFKILQCAIY